jgi:hypothetical protein
MRVLCLALVYGCAILGTPPLVQAQASTVPDFGTIQAEREALSATYVRCLKRAAKKLDDHRSDPATIAQGMMAACRNEFDADVEAQSRYLPDYVQGREKVAQQLRQWAFGDSILMVLINRKGK